VSALAPGRAWRPGSRPRRARTRMGRPRLWRVVILVAALIYFFGPLVASIKYSLIQANGSYSLGNYAQILSNGALRSSMFTSLDVTARAPRWSAAERDTARMVFAYACGPVTAKSPEWLARSLRRISAPRIAAQLCAELARRESVWTAALGDGYASLRHRCAPRTRIRSRGLADLLRADADCRAAVTARLERWVISGGALQELPRELEAAVVHVRTPARLA